MKFFKGCRPQFYFDGGRLTKDKKTDKQIWTLKMVITMKGEEAIHCDDVILNNFMAIETRENLVEEIVIGHTFDGACIEFYSLADHTAPVLFCMTDLTDLRLTRDGDLTELHLKFDIENTDKVHQFVRNHVFTRLWAEFTEQQRSFPMARPKPRIISLGEEGIVN
jgi:HJR/Mrr/RecB family endonuclease